MSYKVSLIIDWLENAKYVSQQSALANQQLAS